MTSQGSTLARKAFGHSADAGLVVSSESYQVALRFLTAALNQENGIALLLGPRGAGHTSFIREQLSWWPREVPVAVFDGRKSATR